MLQWTNPLIAFELEMEFPYKVRDTMHVLDDGQVWFWSFGASDSRLRNRAGTFHFTLEPARRDVFRKLATEVAALPAFAPPIGRGVPQLTVRVGTVTHSHFPGAGGPAPMQAAYGQLVGAMSRAEESPLSVVQLSIRAQQPSLPNKGATNALFVFESIGSQMVQFLLRPETFGLMGITDTSKTFGWENNPNESMGLIKGMGELVDGIYQPAEMNPGEKATAAFLNVVQPTRPKTALSGGVEGMIAVVNTNGQLDSFPDMPIWLAASAGEVVMSS
jgi:hypothetical protein